ncbi:MAG: ATP-binding protein [Phycisphaerales bacterium]|nr:MAG: ATP-binding protein [Phycisphaerales bacterium]
MNDAASSPHLRLEMLSQARLLSAARSMVGNFAQRLGFNEVECGQISLAVDEALCNIINHGYEKRDDGQIWLSVWGLEGEQPGIRVMIEDAARQVEPDQIKSRDLDDVRPGGLGVFIIHEIMDEVKYDKREQEGMRLTMVKRLSSDSRPTSSSNETRHEESSHSGKGGSDHA